MPSLTKNPVAVVNDPQFGTIPWANPDGFRVKYYGEARAEILSGQDTQYAAAAYDFSDLPPGVTLLGIKAEVQANMRLCEAYVIDASVRIGQAGVPAGTDKAVPPPNVWQLSQQVRVYGGQADLWDAGLDADAIRAAGLNLFFAGRWFVGNGGDGTGPAKLRGDDMKITLFW